MSTRARFAVGDRLVHARFGTGLVVEVRERGFYDVLEVAFDEGVKRLTSIHPDIVGHEQATAPAPKGARRRKESPAEQKPVAVAAESSTARRQGALANRRAAASRNAVTPGEESGAEPRGDKRSNGGPFANPVLVLDPGHRRLLTRYRRSQFAHYREVRLKLQAEELAARRGATELQAFDMVRDVIRYPHQEKAARLAIEDMRGRALLADEVGLGKTIEAGIILSEYVLRGLVRRALVLVPASLQRQWRDELRLKFGLKFHIRRRGERFRGYPFLITTLDTARVGKNQKEILEQNYDLVIVDEAHRLKNHRTLSYDFASALASRRLLLLTATPVHNDLRELYNLVTLLRPGALGTFSAFRRQFVARGDRRQPKNTPELARRLGQVMVRTRREDTKIPFPQRTAETAIIEPTDEERALYEDVTRFVRAGYNDPKLKKAASGWHLTLQVLQKEVGSSARAAVRTLEKVAERCPAEAARAEARELARRADALRASSKLAHVTELIDGTDDKVIIFTQFRGTLRYITEALTEREVDVSTFYGGMTDTQREEAVRRFRDEARVLVSTDAGGEGRNLQFCRRVVNFDLPWNPMKIEQRIGRVHRLGQEREVFVHNCSANRTVEAHVLTILQDKLNMFELVVGELDLILGNYPESPAIEDTVFKLWASTEDDDEIERGFYRLGEELALARERYEHIRELDRQIFESLREAMR
jgi:superfamily II DNA or RNA helicase